MYAIQVELFPTANYFEPGHRIRIEVSSSDFPNFGRNLNTGKSSETTTEMRVAHTRILHSRDYPSQILLPLIPAGTTTAPRHSARRHRPPPASARAVDRVTTRTRPRTASHGSHRPMRGPRCMG